MRKPGRKETFLQLAGRFHLDALFELYEVPEMRHSFRWQDRAAGPASTKSDARHFGNNHPGIRGTDCGPGGLAPVT